MRMRPFGRLIPWAEARRRLLDAVRPVTRTETVAVEAAVDRVAADPVRARIAVPPFDRATWDGYAFAARAARRASPARPVRLPVVGEVFAEGGFRGRLAFGSAVAIATGGAVPRGADTVVPFEEVEERPGAIRLRTAPRAGARIASVGEDLPKGARILAPGQLLGPAELGALALTGTARVRVLARPRVTIVPNGNELRRPGRRLGPGAIYESNNASLAGLVVASGGIARTMAPVPDDRGAIARALRAALATSDLVLSTGGSSVGERDLLPAVMPEFGRPLFHGIAVRPGKPTLAVEARGKLLIGMPGHPTSCLSNGWWLLLPVLRRLAGRPGEAWHTERVRLSGSVDLPSAELATIIPLAVANGRARPTFRGSSAIASLGGANAFAVWPPGRAAPTAGRRLLANVLDPPLVGAPPA